ncbi:hypothetical protein B0A53_01831 [Rhodotorula sp. CCFEE 5036]|nr:hypothetical protein B0A53_01831 [Rhodotorula sp. CCFEE 5036]
MFPGNGGSGAFGAAGGPSTSSSSSFNTAPPNSANGAPAGPPRHTNLSWRKPDDTAPIAADETVEATVPNPEASTSAFGSGGSAFAAFGAAANGGFGSSSGAKQDGSSSIAFGAAPSAFTSTAFGSGAPAGPPNPFGAASTSSAFPSTSAQSPFGGGSAFASFTSAASDGHMPLFRAASSEAQDDGGDDGAASLGEEAAAAAPKKRNPAQISTLEVLGEDSDARKKRFEATLPNNRYLELKPRREEQRLAAIKAGTIPDPSKPMRLDQATDFEGTCQDMCPEWEREEREYQNNVDPLERYPGTTRIDPARAVKAFHRPAAGNDQPLPSDVRPAPVLQRTLDYLFHTLLPTQPLAATHPFLRDRTRSVRQDFTVQNVRDVNAVRCNERIARYHILAVGVLREEAGFSEQQELEQLRKVLKSLNEFYDDLRLSGTPDPSGNEAEFRAYNLLTHLRDPDIVWSVELLPPEIFGHPLLQRALALHRLAQKSNIPRGERASQNAFSRFFKLVSDPGTPYLFACILSTHFNDIRRNAIDALRSAYLKQHSAFPLRTLAKILGCDDEADARSVCEQLGVVVRTDERGRVVAELHKQAALKAGGLRPKVARRLVEGKRGKTPYQVIIDGSTDKPFDVAAIPSTPSTAAPPSFGGPVPLGNVSSAPPPPPSTFPTSQQPAPAFPKPTPFGTSQISTPVVTPPRIATPGPPRSATATGLDAAAPAFVPSFGQPQSQPKPPAPTTPQPKPIFTSTAFAPNAEAFVPAHSTAVKTQAADAFRPLSTAPPSAPAFALPPSGPSTSSALPKPFLSAAIPISTQSTPPAKVSTEPKPALSTSPKSLRRVSITPASPARPSPAARAAAARRTQLVNNLVQHFTAEIISASVEGAIHRSAASALKERWNTIRAEEAKVKQVLATAVASRALAELGRMASRETIYRAWRDMRRQRSAWNDWKQAVQRSMERRALEAEARQDWREVVGAIGAGEVAPASDDGDAVMLEEDEDDEGLAGSDDAGLAFDGLSLRSDAPDAAPTAKADRIDSAFADRINSAAQEREKLWAPGTFLNIVADSASRAIANSHLDKRPFWSTLIVTPSISAPFAAWLACKFDLDPSVLSVEFDTPEADICVEMVPLKSRIDENVFDHVGLLLFDCTEMPEIPVAARRQFADIVSAMLGLTESSGLAQVAIYPPDLTDAEASFSREAAKLLDSVHVITGRLERPLRGFVETLARAWRTTLAKQKRSQFALSRPEAVKACLRVLQELSDDVESAAIPRVKQRLSLPRFEQAGAPFEAVVQSFVQDPVFETAGHFPALRTLLAARPPLPNHVIARSLVDHVAEFVFARLREQRTRQEVLDDVSPKIYVRFEASLAKLEQELEALSAESSSSKAGGPNKKRRASSASPLDLIVSSPKKQANGVNGVKVPEKAATKARPQDRLLALEDLMRDARTLLAKT